MFCMNCGKEIPEDAAFCMSCGTKVGDSSGTSTNDSNYVSQRENDTLGSMKNKFFKAASKAAVKTSELLGSASEKLGEMGNKVGQDDTSTTSMEDVNEPSAEEAKNIQASEDMGKIFYEGPANMLYDNLVGKVGYAKGGKLFLAENGLYFKSHSLNVGEKEWSMPISAISGVKKTMRLVLGIPSPNMIQVSSKAGDKYFFVVSKKEIWIEQISSHI